MRKKEVLDNSIFCDTLQTALLRGFCHKVAWRGFAVEGFFRLVLQLGFALQQLAYTCLI